MIKHRILKGKKKVHNSSLNEIQKLFANDKLCILKNHTFHKPHKYYSQSLPSCLANLRQCFFNHKKFWKWIMNWKNCYLTKDKANTSIDCSLSSNYTVTSKLKIHVNINIKVMQWEHWFSLSSCPTWPTLVLKSRKRFWFTSKCVATTTEEGRINNQILEIKRWTLMDNFGFQ